MVRENTVEEAIDVLQQFGLKEYEAKCFVGLTRMSTSTAKQLSEVVDVPRTRIYDAIRVLEAQGLVEVQHTSPQRFRAVPLDEATETLRTQYESRVDRLRNALAAAEPVDAGDDDPVQEVWSMSGKTAVANRAHELIEEAETEVVLVVASQGLLTEGLVDALNAVGEGTDLLVGAVTDDLRKRVEDAVPNAETFVSGLDWLQSEDDGSDGDHETAIGRLLLVDRSTILVSTIIPETGEEQAVFGTGFGNGLVVISRRLMAQGLLTDRDPSADD
ncbi:TrmB family transcriptional regulator [Halostella litorea]|uniref:TrmB family transcriptional regulator n=1 Tax=Halostella litorea TaxID=2528831 RepID=UPI001092648F|nr:helix-turn-helix domain-containing protein [Halostella litorea]